MRFQNFLTLMLGVLFTVGCSQVTNAELTSKKNLGEGSLAQITGYERTYNELVFHVVSTGCSTSDHFSLHTQSTDKLTVVSLVRTKPDLCRKMPRSVGMPFELKDYDLLGAEFIVENPISKPMTR